MLKVYRHQKGASEYIGEVEPGGTLFGLYEYHEYEIRSSGEVKQIFVDDQPLQSFNAAGGCLWQSGFYSGQVAVEASVYDSSKLVRFTFDIAPDPTKTGRQQYQQYISDIVRLIPDMIIGNQAATIGMAGRSSNLNKWIRYSRIRTYFNRFLDGLKTIMERPITKPLHRRELLPIQLVRKVDITTINRLTSNAAMLSAIVSNSKESLLIENSLDNRLDIPYSEPTFDNPANRVIKAQISMVLKSMEEVKVFFEECEDKATDLFEKERLPRKIKFLKDSRKVLTKVLRREPFTSAGFDKGTVVGLNVVSGNPDYAFTHGTGVKLLKRGIADEFSSEMHYTPPTWQVYESWCFCILVESLKTLYPYFNWELKKNISNVDMLFEGFHEEDRIRLYSQLRCPSDEKTNNFGYCSISRERIPDYVLEIKINGKKSFICLDAKYKASRSRLLEAMASAHIYRDSVKLDGKPPQSVFLITPNVDNVANLVSAEYKQRNHVGCQRLSVEDDALSILRELTNWLMMPKMDNVNISNN